MSKKAASKAVQVFILLAVAMIIAPAAAFASSSGMPWETPLNSILDSITGPVAKVIGVLAICITGLMLAFGESGGMMKRAIQVCFGLSIAFSAASWGLTFFGFSGGLAF